MNKKIYIVMPIANEEESIEELLRSILSLDVNNLHIVTVMDQYSKDRTYDIVKEMSRENPNIHLIFHDKSTGVVSCYIFGFKYALDCGADYIIEMDGGGSHDPNEIPNFIKYLNQGYDCVFGSRFIKGGGIENHPFYRRLISKYGTLLANVVLGTNFFDMTSGFEGFNRKVLEKIDLDNMLSINISHFYQTEMKYYCSGFNIIEIPIKYRGSKSSLKFKTIYRSFFALFALKRRGIILKSTTF